MRFTLKGDDLKAVILDEDYSPYVNDTEFDGKYQRGDSFEDVFGAVKRTLTGTAKMNWAMKKTTATGTGAMTAIQTIRLRELPKS
jgi:hypothetical protein